MSRIEINKRYEASVFAEPLRCPFKKGHKFDYCIPSVWKGSEHCGKCPDYWKNYEYILDDDLRRAEANPDDNIHHIRKEIERDGGKFVQFSDRDYGILVAATSTIEDYYWVFINYDMKIKLWSCVGGYEIMDENDLPMNLSVLEYLHRNNKKSLRERVKKELERYKHDRMISKIYV